MRSPLRRFWLCWVALLLTGAVCFAEESRNDAGLAAADAGDFEKARRIWLSQAEAGNASAQNNLGVLYAKGQGVPRDYRQAAEWFRRAAEQGDAAAQSNLGIFYAKGQGVPQDDKQAVKWFLLGARQGDANAQFNLGIMYDVGRGVTQNEVVACAWYLLALENGERIAQRYLAEVQQHLTPVEIEMAQQIAEQMRQEIGAARQVP